MSETEFDLCIIGGGSAGLVVAAGGAALGAKVALVEKRALGGDCLYYGCVPSKALLHSAKVAQTLREAETADIAPPAPSLTQAMERVTRVIRSIEPQDSPERFRSMGVEVIFGEGRFVDPARFRVDGRDLRARKFVLATGSRPAVPPIEGLHRSPYLTNESVFDLREPVPHLLVLGAGPIGVELAQAFRRLGSAVQVVDQAAQTLPREDADMAEVVKARLAGEGVRFHLKRSVSRVESASGTIRMRLQHADDGESWLEGTHLLVAVGRKPNLENLGLESAGVAVENGHLKTDRRLRTSNPRIYACGDVVGPYLFTHTAEHQAGVVLKNALFHWPARAESRVVPWCTFTDPELARVGLSEAEAREREIRYEAYAFRFAEIDRAVTDEETAGRAKIITDSGGKLLGAAIAGANAGELIHEYALALARNLKAADLSDLIHIYPTLAQINRKVAEQRRKQKLTPAARRWIQRLFGLRGERRA
jgi:pyruvate/2-oxoglutarate dehydrogenase complex dihydrolipoamide dehydrogenase (E3) component